MPLHLVKIGELSEEATVVPGDIVNCSFQLTNTGNMKLSNDSIADALEGISEIVYGDWPNDDGVLAPWQSLIASSTHALTRSDIDANQ